MRLALLCCMGPPAIHYIAIGLLCMTVRRSYVFQGCHQCCRPTHLRSEQWALHAGCACCHSALQSELRVQSPESASLSWAGCEASMITTR